MGTLWSRSGLDDASFRSAYNDRMVFGGDRGRWKPRCLSSALSHAPELRLLSRGYSAARRTAASDCNSGSAPASSRFGRCPAFAFGVILDLIGSILPTPK